MAVDIELEMQGKPRLELDVDEPEVGVHEVVVEEQALALGELHVVALLPAQGERAAGFDHRVDADQALLDPIAFGQGAGQLVFVAGSWQVLTGPAGRLGHPAGVGLEALGLLDHEALEVPAMDVVGLEEGGHGIAAEERQVAPEHQAVKAGQGPLDGVC
ncbi:MAG: hypothetical protein DMD83_13650, partial [Candidatus Rokuibacteriota bacterium]